MFWKNSKFNGLTLIMAFLALSMYSCKTDTSKAIEEKTENLAEEIDKAATNLKEEIESIDSEAEGEMEAGRDMPVYNMTQVDVPPLFDLSCKTAKDQGKCSEEKLLAFIKKNAKFPQRASKNASSLEQVLIVIEDDGSVSSTKFVASGNQEACKGCQQAAVDVVGKMKNWVPAVKDGKAVAVKLTIPIRFRG